MGETQDWKRLLSRLHRGEVLEGAVNRNVAVLDRVTPAGFDVMLID
jgi:hypothetical protein